MLLFSRPPEGEANLIQQKKQNASVYIRTRSVINVEKHTKINLNNRIVTSFLSNDYLGMSKNRSIISELKKSANTHGIGSGSSPLISGYSESHHYLEKEIAEYLKITTNQTYLWQMKSMEINIIQTFACQSSRCNICKSLDFTYCSSSKMQLFQI